MIAFDTTDNCKPYIKQMLAEGVTAVGRYYVSNRSSWKCLKKPEALSLSKAGISIFSVYQIRQNQTADFDESHGELAATNALIYAHDVIGQPKGSAIYFAVDYDPSKSEIDNHITPYFEAIARQFKKDGNFDVGVYGSGNVCTALKDKKLVTYTWLTQSAGFAGSKAYDKSKKWNIKQLLPAKFHGMEVDPNEINLDNGYFGSFLLEG